MNAPTLVVIAMVPLVAWRLYARARRFIGRQRSRAWRHWTAVVVFPVLLALFGVAASLHPAALGALAGGVVAGAVLAVAGLKLTRFERAADGWFYTPNAHIGIGLSVLLAARIAWRLLESPLRPGAAHAQLASSPLTLAIFGMFAAYYTVYAAGLLRWRHGARAAGPGNIAPD